MHRRMVRVSVVLIMLAAVTGSVYKLFQAQQQIDNSREVEQAFVAGASVLAVSLSYLRAAQQAYVATGQDSGYWIEKVSAGMTELSVAFDRLERLALTTTATEALAEARVLLERLGHVDTLAREHTAAGQDLMASDLIFTDGLELATLVTRQLELARTAEQQVHTQSRLQQRQNQMLSLAALVTTTIVVTFLLFPAGVRPAPDPANEEVQSGDLDTADAEVQAHAAIAEPRAPPSENAVAVASPHHAELQRAAELCTDLGQLTSAERLPRLVERAAELLHASGLIVWVRDASGTGLRPAVAHGYSGATLAQLGSVACSSDNAAATAYRTRQLQVVPVDGTTRGALVVPLLGPDDCVGVISAEVRAGWESSADVQATAAILAAQFATVVSADPVGEIESERAQG